MQKFSRQNAAQVVSQEHDIRLSHSVLLDGQSTSADCPNPSNMLEQGLQSGGSAEPPPDPDVLPESMG